MAFSLFPDEVGFYFYCRLTDRWTNIRNQRITDSQTDEWTLRRREVWTIRLTNGTNRQMDRQKERRIDSKTDKLDGQTNESNIETDRGTHGHTGEWTDGQIQRS